MLELEGEATDGPRHTNEQLQEAKLTTTDTILPCLCALCALCASVFDFLSHK